MKKSIKNKTNKNNQKKENKKIRKLNKDKKNKEVFKVERTENASRTSKELISQQILEEREEKEVIGYSECPECGSKNLAREKGEIYCKDCGYVLEEREE
ncbi:MAG: TFIIB-type zinc ribbon-containing protein [Candidatus Woesearchaeota archaeon]